MLWQGDGGGIIAAGMIADPHKQQIPPLRFAPVGMTA
jgi:hypothetical protein